MGLSVAIRSGPILPISIRVERDSYLIEGAPKPFERTATNETLQNWTELLLPIFSEIVRADHQADQGNEWYQIDFSNDQRLKEFIDRQIEELRTWGQRAFVQFFDTDARDLLTRTIQFHEKRGSVVAPYFWSRQTPFPWELLVPPSDDLIGDPALLFWGMRYPISRNMTELPFESHPEEQDLRSNMLFGLHHKLIFTHQHELPALEKLVKARGDIYVLGGQVGFGKTVGQMCDAKILLKYLYTSRHNMLHFACHCMPGRGDDVLHLSLVEDATQITGEGGSGEPQSVCLGTFTFLDQPGTFQNQQPLVFLNACQTTGENDAVHLQFNLPEKFVDSKAAGVIATICPVPDTFAAVFAEKFYEYFLRDGVEIGEALRATRWYFWEKYHNPLGLAYGLYSSPYYRVPSRQPEESLV